MRNSAILQSNLRQDPIDYKTGGSSLWVMDPWGSCRAIILPERLSGYTGAVELAWVPCSWSLQFVCMDYEVAEALSAGLTLPHNLFRTPRPPPLPPAVPSSAGAPAEAATGSSPTGSSPAVPVPAGYRLVRTGIKLGHQKVPEGAKFFTGLEVFARSGPVVNIVGRWKSTGLDALRLVAAADGPQVVELAMGNANVPDYYGDSTLYSSPIWAATPLPREDVGSGNLRTSYITRVEGCSSGTAIQRLVLVTAGGAAAAQGVVNFASSGNFAEEVAPGGFLAAVEGYFLDRIMSSSSTPSVSPNSAASIVQMWFVWAVPKNYTTPPADGTQFGTGGVRGIAPRLSPPVPVPQCAEARIIIPTNTDVRGRAECGVRSEESYACPSYLCCGGARGRVGYCGLDAAFCLLASCDPSFGLCESLPFYALEVTAHEGILGVAPAHSPLSSPPPFTVELDTPDASIETTTVRFGSTIYAMDKSGTSQYAAAQEHCGTLSLMGLSWKLISLADAFAFEVSLLARQPFLKELDSRVVWMQPRPDNVTIGTPNCLTAAWDTDAGSVQLVGVQATECSASATVVCKATWPASQLNRSSTPPDFYGSGNSVADSWRGLGSSASPGPVPYASAKGGGAPVARWTPGGHALSFSLIGIGAPNSGPSCVFESFRWFLTPDQFAAVRDVWEKTSFSTSTAPTAIPLGVDANLSAPLIALAMRPVLLWSALALQASMVYESVASLAVQYARKSGSDHTSLPPMVLGSLDGTYLSTNASYGARAPIIDSGTETGAGATEGQPSGQVLYNGTGAGVAAYLSAQAGWESLQLDLQEGEVIVEMAGCRGALLELLVVRTSTGRLWSNPVGPGLSCTVPFRSTPPPGGYLVGVQVFGGNYIEEVKLLWGTPLSVGKPSGLGASRQTSGDSGNGAGVDSAWPIIVGVTVGCVLVTLLAGTVFVIWRRRRRSRAVGAGGSYLRGKGAAAEAGDMSWRGDRLDLSSVRVDGEDPRGPGAAAGALAADGAFCDSNAGGLPSSSTASPVQDASPLAATSASSEPAAAAIPSGGVGRWSGMACLPTLPRTPECPTEDGDKAVASAPGVAAVDARRTTSATLDGPQGVLEPLGGLAIWNPAGLHRSRSLGGAPQRAPYAAAEAARTGGPSLLSGDVAGGPAAAQRGAGSSGGVANGGGIAGLSGGGGSSESDPHAPAAASADAAEVAAEGRNGLGRADAAAVTAGPSSGCDSCKDGLRDGLIVGQDGRTPSTALSDDVIGMVLPLHRAISRIHAQTIAQGQLQPPNRPASRTAGRVALAGGAVAVCSGTDISRGGTVTNGGDGTITSGGGGGEYDTVSSSAAAYGDQRSRAQALLDNPSPWSPTELGASGAASGVGSPQSFRGALGGPGLLPQRSTGAAGPTVGEWPDAWAQQLHDAIFHKVLFQLKPPSLAVMPGGPDVCPAPALDDGGPGHGYETHPASAFAAPGAATYDRVGTHGQTASGGASAATTRGPYNPAAAVVAAARGTGAAAGHRPHTGAHTGAAAGSSASATPVASSLFIPSSGLSLEGSCSADTGTGSHVTAAEGVSPPPSGAAAMAPVHTAHTGSGPAGTASSTATRVQSSALPSPRGGQDGGSRGALAPLQSISSRPSSRVAGTMPEGWTGPYWGTGGETCATGGTSGTGGTGGTGHSGVKAAGGVVTPAGCAGGSVATSSTVHSGSAAGAAGGVGGGGVHAATVEAALRFGGDALHHHRHEDVQGRGQLSPQPRVPQHSTTLPDSLGHGELLLGRDVRVDREDPGTYLGHGTSGVVRRGLLRQPDGSWRQVAVKLLNRPDDQEVESYRKHLKTLLQEMTILGSLRHPNIVQLLGGSVSLQSGDSFLVEELCGRTLSHAIYAESMPYSLPLVLRWSADIARGLAYLHPNIMHRDLKPSNVLLDHSGTAKISDFGLARFKLHTTLVTRDAEVGTTCYMSPECFVSSDFKVTAACDVYSLGVMMNEMATRTRPWSGVRTAVVGFKVAVVGARPQLPAEASPLCTPQLRQLILDCWAQHPEDRPTSAQVLARLQGMMAELGGAEWAEGEGQQLESGGLGGAEGQVG